MSGRRVSVSECKRRRLPSGGSAARAFAAMPRHDRRATLCATLCHRQGRFQPESAGFGARPWRPLKPLWQAEKGLPEQEAPTGIEPV